MEGGKNPAAVVLLVFLAILPLLPTLISVLRTPWPDHVALDDVAVLELRTMEAARGRHLLGPYSRFGWSHPGPAEFYLLASFHLLSGRKTGALGLGAIVLNIASTVGLAWVAIRLFGLRRGAVLILLFNGIPLALDPSGLASVWNPAITVIPFALFVLLAAAFALEGFRYLPAASLVATFVVQTHLGYLPAVAVVSAAALWERSRMTSLVDDVRRGRGTLALTLGLLVLVWLPPLVEQIRESPGNLTLIVRFFREHGASHEFRDVFQAVSVPLSEVPLRLAKLLVPSTTDRRTAGAGALTLILVALLPLARRRAAATDDAPARVLGTIALALLGSAFWSAANVRDELHPYLLLWVSVVGFAGWGAVAFVLCGPEGDGTSSRSRRDRAALLSAAVVIGLLALRSNVRYFAPGAILPVDPLPNEALRTLTASVTATLRTNQIERPLLSIGSHDQWVPAAGLILDLYKAGVRFSVDENWCFMFGHSFRPTGRETTHLVIGNEELETRLAQRPDYALAGRGGETVVYWHRDPGWLERHTARAAGHVLDVRGTRGDPGVVVDGRVPAPGTVWNSPGCLVLESQDSFVTVAVPEGPVAAVLVSADNNDTYEVAVSRDGVTFEEIGLLPTVPEKGMKEREVFSPKLSGARALRIRPRTGDGAWSVGEVSFVIAEEPSPGR